MPQGRRVRQPDVERAHGAREALRPQRILLVEDDIEQRELLAEILERAGFVVERAIDGRDALDLAQARPPDIVLADLSMPGMDGFDVANHLHADPRTRDIPVVALTGRDISPTAIRMGGPFVDVFFKPVHAQELLGFLEALLKKPLVG